MAAPTTADNSLLPRPQEHPDFPQKAHRSIAWLPLCLLVVSIVTTASTGALLMRNFRLDQPPLASEGDLFPLLWIWNHPSALASGWSFSLALLGILLAHEAGHYFLCRRHGISASWPYVLPAPTLSGTAGAVIRIRSPIPSLDALMDVGISGPIFGFVVAMPATLVGLLLSKTAAGPAQSVLIRLQAPLAMQMLYAPMRWVMPSFPPIGDLLWHPVLIASWVGLFITSLNLIPAGQLDGGHILYAVSRRWHRRATIAVPVLLLAAGITLWVGWLLWE